MFRKCRGTFINNTLFVLIDYAGTTIGVLTSMIKDAEHPNRCI